MLRVKNNTNAGDLDFNGINIPYNGDWVEISNEKLSSVADILYGAYKDGIVLVEGDIESYLRKNNMEVLLCENKEDEKTLEYFKDYFIKRLLSIPFRKLCQLIDQGFYDDISILFELKQKTTNKILIQHIDLRITMLKREAALHV